LFLGVVWGIYFGGWCGEEKKPIPGGMTERKAKAKAKAGARAKAKAKANTGVSPLRITKTEA
jgi:hypothetical protein